MKAITVEPHKPDTARLEDVAEPDVNDGSILVEAIAVSADGVLVRPRCAHCRIELQVDLGIDRDASIAPSGAG